MNTEIRKIIILGGGTAGWMAAAAMARFLDPEVCEITLIESDKIGSVGVGEATIPHIRYFNNMLGIDEPEFLREVGATFKLGIKFVDWGQLGTSYIHPFGSHGYPINGIDFHHYWLAQKKSGEVLNFDQFSLAVAMAEQNRFMYPEDVAGELGNSFTYAYHIDAGRYAKFLRKYAESLHVKRVEGVFVLAECSKENGEITSLHLESGELIEGDLFLDCSGFRAELIGQTIGVAFDDWSNWLLCDSAVAIPSERSANVAPYTVARAHSFGWQWTIPLQHRNGNGLVYSSEYQGVDDAISLLRRNIEGVELGDPNLLSFKAGCRVKGWEKNCIAVGLSSGFLEPLESTSIYLIQQSILKLLEYFPAVRNFDVLRDTFNRDMELEYLRIRDFLILHYATTQRDDSEFWRYCKAMELPESLKSKIKLFTSSGYIERYEQGLFMQPSWLAVYLGQGSTTGGFDGRVSKRSVNDIRMEMESMRGYLNNLVKAMPHAEYQLAAELRCVDVRFRHASSSLYGGLNK